MFLKKEEGEVSPEKLTRIYFWGRGHLKFFSKRGKALEYFGLDVSAAVFPSFPRERESGKTDTQIFLGRGHLKFFSKRGKALEYFGFDVSAAVFPSFPRKQADPSDPSFFCLRRQL